MQRNIVYRVCGYIMISCIVLMTIYTFLQNGIAAPLKKFSPLYWLEALAIIAFGISWLTKGEAILKDEAKPKDS